MKYFLICSCLFAIYFADAQSTTLKIADSFYNGKRYFEASVWYERCLYEEESSYIRVEAINGKLNCLKEQQLFNEALDFVTTCVAMNISDSLRPELIYQQILCSYLSGKFENVKAITTQYASIITNKRMSDKIYLLNILSLNQLMEWQRADSIYEEYCKTHKSEVNIHELYNCPPHLKSEKKARALSTFLPGSGIMYSGHYLEGSLNVMLQLGSLAFGVECFLKKYSFTAWFMGGGMFASFYNGSVRRSEVLVNQYNQRKIGLYNEQLKKKLVNYFSNDN